MNRIIKNGYEISEMTLGTVQLGMNYGINNREGKPSADVAAEILKTAEACGVSVFDTAGAYGDSEKVLGEYFSERKQKPAIVTKVHFEDTDKSKLFDVLAEKVQKSAKKLRLSHIPFLMLHNESYIKKYGDSILSALEKLKNEGAVDNIGASFSDKSELGLLCDTNVFDCIQLPLNLFDNKEIQDGTVKKIASCGTTVFVRSVYLQGLFFMEPEKLPTKLSKAREPLVKIRTLAKEEGVSLSQLALSFVRASCSVGSIVLGCETPSQVRENAELFSGGMLSEKVHNKVLEVSENIAPIIIRPWEWKL